MSLSLPAAADLAQTAAAFAHWRNTTSQGARIPAELWSRAVELAARHGVSKVATTLRLDYAGLKRRLTARTAPLPVPTTAPPAFVEMMLGLPPSGPGCVLTLSDARGRSLRIEWTGAATGEVATVACRLWEAAPCLP
ncbi:hypothetical protein [Candidatus Thiodictyon syntrophicum]|uniref:Uncharacterized protein n=1 Tax=Candidatus Thiodictyon syntrophicum TaxID=1166950 RepID=A0A2K8UCF1_9GAMM|nr:hypothetical protein [Candidatus Thiodictyon syntrophicum]AUB81126.1 hypothetical protein THSYN_09285 [Candidatus Thiodictyon syntrophicum]AUB82731.1 hypothetical protein THSYN_18495 [Candidatus Thiodictyon syntrophicum]AUB85057.1 hypothetical protein THSYN_29430 [Candidatus Thiodictyon syntrophicum]AUB85205.1 hypothetical protein THSYN_30275 [Candidatus Thiodictyon syntrophicum]